MVNDENKDVLDRPLTIRVKPQQLRPALSKRKPWWTWEMYQETWKRLDADPDVALETLPLYAVMHRILTDLGREASRGDVEFFRFEGAGRTAAVCSLPQSVRSTDG